MHSTAPILSVNPASAKTTAAASRDYAFYLAFAILSAVVTFVGFSRSYYLKSIFPSPKLPLLFHVHGFVFSLWMPFLVLQIWLMRDGRVSVHRQLGYAGAGLASLMVVLGVAISFASARMGHFSKIPLATNAEEACLFSLFDIILFAVFLWAGFFFRHDAEAHQRLMVLATVTLLPSGIGRMCNFHPVIATPIIFAFFLAGPIYDLITRHRVHRAYVAGLLILLLTGPPMRILLARTELWHAFYRRTVG